MIIIMIMILFNNKIYIYITIKHNYNNNLKNNYKNNLFQKKKKKKKKKTYYSFALLTVSVFSFISVISSSSKDLISQFANSS